MSGPTPEEVAMWFEVERIGWDLFEASYEPRLPLADWYEERGNDLLAYALRWAARMGKRPYHVRVSEGRMLPVNPEDLGWTWWSNVPSGFSIDLTHAALGAPLADCFEDRPGNRRSDYFQDDTCRDAYWSLAIALDVMGRIYRGESFE